MSKRIDLFNKSEVPVVIYLDIKNPEDVVILSKEEEVPYEKLEESALPENIIRINSKWARVTWTLSSIIDMNQYIDRVVAGRVNRLFDPNQLVASRIRTLLKSWDLAKVLDDKNKSLVELQFEQSIDNRSVQILNIDTLNRIGQISPSSVVNALYNRAMDILFPEEGRALKNLMKLSENQGQK